MTLVVCARARHLGRRHAALAHDAARHVPITANSTPLATRCASSVKNTVLVPLAPMPTTRVMRPSLGLAALRVVLQHTCQADCECSPRDPTPDRCFVVTLRAAWKGASFATRMTTFTKIIYSPALTSRENAWRLSLEKWQMTWSKTAIHYTYELEALDMTKMAIRIMRSANIETQRRALEL